MNLSAYIFGNFSGTPTQYPSDYTGNIFKKFNRLSTGEDVVLTHRDGDLMYYAYIRKLSGNQHFGICLVINGLMIESPTILFQIFESVFAKAVMEGELIKLSDTGQLTSAVQAFTDKISKCEKLTGSIVSEFKRSKISTSKLPPVSFGTGIEEVKKVSIQDDISDIANYTCKYSYTVITRTKAENTAGLNDYISTIRRINLEKTNLLQNFQKLSDEHSKLKKAKKQFQLVVILLAGLSICGIGLFLLYSNLSSTENTLSSTKMELGIANKTILFQSDELQKKSDSISELKRDFAAEVDIRKKAEEKLDEMTGKISGAFPLIITNIEVQNEKRDGTVINSFGSAIYSRDTYYLTPRITYYGFTSEDVYLNVKLYTPNGLSTANYSTFSYQTSFKCSQGTNTRSISGWGNNSAGNWGPGRYTFEFWYGDYCVGAHSFLIR